MKQKLKITAGVNCKSKRHKISLTEQGKLIFHDHPEGFKEDSVLTSLGGEACKCYKVLSAWKENIGKSCRKSNKKDIPKEFEEVFDKIYTVKSQRLSKKRSEEVFSSFDKNRKRTIYLLTKLFFRSRSSQLGFTTTRPIVEDFWRTETGVSVKSQITMGNYSEIRLSGMPLLKIYIKHLPVTWYEKVYKRGIALVNNNLVLSLLGEQENQEDTLLKVIALYNSGNSYSAKPAVIRIKGDTKAFSWDVSETT